MPPVPSWNLSVWQFLGSGTIDLTRGPFRIAYSGPVWLFGSGSGAGLLALAATVLVVGIVSVSLRGRRDMGEEEPAFTTGS